MKILANMAHMQYHQNKIPIVLSFKQPHLTAIMLFLNEHEDFDQYLQYHPG